MALAGASPLSPSWNHGGLSPRPQQYRTSNGGLLKTLLPPCLSDSTFVLETSLRRCVTLFPSWAYSPHGPYSFFLHLSSLAGIPLTSFSKYESSSPGPFTLYERSSWATLCLIWRVVAILSCFRSSNCFLNYPLLFFRMVDHSQASNFLTTGLEPTQLEERIHASLNQYAFVF